MVIALNEVAAESFWPRLVILLFVAVVITAVVYGVVAGIVMMDDVGLHFTQRSALFVQRIGRGLVAGMPKLLSFLSVVGTAAMLWVGGHILLVGNDTLGWHGPYSSCTTPRSTSTTSAVSAPCSPGWSTLRLGG